MGLCIKLDRQNPFVSLTASVVYNTITVFITVKHNLYSILKELTRLHVLTLWRSSSGLYNVLKLSIHKRYFASGIQ
jgi:hypothetical protein